MSHIQECFYFLWPLLQSAIQCQVNKPHKIYHFLELILIVIHLGQFLFHKPNILLHYELYIHLHPKASKEYHKTSFFQHTLRVLQYSSSISQAHHMQVNQLLIVKQQTLVCILRLFHPQYTQIVNGKCRHLCQLQVGHLMSNIYLIPIQLNQQNQFLGRNPRRIDERIQSQLDWLGKMLPRPHLHDGHPHQDIKHVDEISTTPIFLTRCRLYSKIHLLHISLHDVILLPNQQLCLHLHQVKCLPHQQNRHMTIDKIHTDLQIQDSLQFTPLRIVFFFIYSRWFSFVIHHSPASFSSHMKNHEMSEHPYRWMVKFDNLLAGSMATPINIHFSIKIKTLNKGMGHCDATWFHWMIFEVVKLTDLLVIEVGDFRHQLNNIIMHTKYSVSVSLPHNRFYYQRMGSQQSSESFLKEPIRYESNPRYGECVVMKDPLGSSIYQSVTVDESSAQHFINLLQNRMKLHHPNLITPSKYIVKPRTEPCSLDVQLQIFIEYQNASRSLQDQIARYCKERRPFPQPQLRRIFICIIQALIYLQNHQTCHGDIKPTNIMIDSYGYVKLIDSYFVNGGKISYEIVMDNPSSMSLLSPQQLATLRNKQFQSIGRVHESQMWAIGLTMLEAMTAEPAMECYNLSHLQIKPHYFSNKYRELINHGYSVQLSTLVMDCILRDEHHRPNFIQFLHVLRGVNKSNRFRRY